MALLALGCAVAAAAAGTGPLLAADRDVAPAFRRMIGVRERPEPAESTGGFLDRVTTLVDLLLQGVALSIALGLLLYGLWQVARVLLRLRAITFVGRGAAVATREYEDESTDADAESVLRRRVREDLLALSADLDAAGDPREAVIACYVRMEEALADAGSPRRASESPLELLTRVLGEQHVPETDVRTLTALFMEARFSTHPVTDDMRRDARRALDGVAGALSGAAS